MLSRMFGFLAVPVAVLGLIVAGFAVTRAALAQEGNANVGGGGTISIVVPPPSGGVPALPALPSPPVAAERPSCSAKRPTCAAKRHPYPTGRRRCRTGCRR